MFVAKFARPLMRAYHTVQPEAAATALKGGQAILVDLRGNNEGISLPNAHVVPFETVLGSERGAVAPSEYNREELINKLTEEQLGVNEYHALGELTRKRISQLVGKDLSHAEADKVIVDTLKQAEGGPAAFAKANGSKDAVEDGALQQTFLDDYTSKLARVRYNPNVTKAELAEKLSNDQLARLTGDAFPNLQADALGAGARGVDALKDLPSGQSIFLIDRCGVHSKRVAEFMEKNGYSGVSVIDGGVDRWAIRGGEIQLSEQRQAELNEASVLRGAPGGLNEIND